MVDTTVTPDTNIPLVHTATQEPSAIVDHPPPTPFLPPLYPSRDCRSSQFSDILYPTYSTYFLFFSNLHPKKF